MLTNSDQKKKDKEDALAPKEANKEKFHLGTGTKAVETYEKYMQSDSAAAKNDTLESLIFRDVKLAYGLPI